MKRILTFMFGIVAVLAAANESRAGVAIAVSSDGVNFTNVPLTAGSSETSADAAAQTVTVGGVTLTGLHSASLTYPGTPTGSVLNSTSGSAAGSGTVYVAYSISGFTQPIGSVKEITSVSATGTQPGGGTATITSWATNGGALVGTGTLPTVTNQVGPTSVTVANAQSAGSPTPSLSFTGLTNPYTLTSLVKVDLGTGGGFSFNGTDQIFAQPVPEPGTLALASVAIIGAVGYRRKRRLVR